MRSQIKFSQPQQPNSSTIHQYQISSNIPTSVPETNNNNKPRLQWNNQ